MTNQKTLALAVSQKKEDVKDNGATKSVGKKGVKMVKPPKKKKKADTEEENFDKLVDSYRSKFEEIAKGKSPREKVKEKRWFE